MSDFNLSEEETRKASVLAKSVALETFVQFFSVQNFERHFVFEYSIN